MVRNNESDLDGVGIVVDFATRTLGLPETDYYQSFHRMFGHRHDEGDDPGVLAGGLPSERADAVFVATLRAWRQRVLSVVGRRK